MEMLRPADVPSNERDLLFRYSVARALFGVFVVFCAGGVLLIIAWQQGSGLAYYLGGLLIATPLLMRRRLFARLKPSNWLLRMSDAGLYIQFRSFLNYHFPKEDQTVVLIPYHEIRSARLVRERRDIPDSFRRGSSIHFRRLVEFELAGDTAELSEALRIERSRPIPREPRWYGSGGHRYNDYPVRLANPACLELEWSVVPSAKRFLQAMSRRTDVLTSIATSKDFAGLEKLSREEQENRLLELAETGDKMAAVKLARELYSYDLKEAKEFVETLAGGSTICGRTPKQST